jgi:hypothetical protein
MYDEDGGKVGVDGTEGVVGGTTLEAVGSCCWQLSGVESGSHRLLVGLNV